MGRKTKQNKITSAEKTALINKENLRLMEDFLSYLKSIGRSETTIRGYKSDCLIFFTWCLENAGNKFYVDISKRDIVAYQNWLLSNNENSPARIRRLKSTISSLGNYVENVLDDEYKDFRCIVRKIESPVNQPVRQKTVLTDEQCQVLLKTLVDDKKYEQACCVALAMYSGRRKAELVRFKCSYFDDSNIIYGSIYRTPEKVLTKGRGGKMLTLYTFTKFKLYFEMWMQERERLGIESEWLFPDKKDPTKQLSVSTLDSWAEKFSKILGLDFYWHSLRHFWTSENARKNLPDSVIQKLSGWSDISLVGVYKDIDIEDELGKYFDENGIKDDIKVASLSDL